MPLHRKQRNMLVKGKRKKKKPMSKAEMEEAAEPRSLLDRLKGMKRNEKPKKKNRKVKRKP